MKRSNSACSCVVGAVRICCLSIQLLQFPLLLEAIEDLLELFHPLLALEGQFPGNVIIWVFGQRFLTTMRSVMSMLTLQRVRCQASDISNEGRVPASKSKSSGASQGARAPCRRQAKRWDPSMQDPMPRRPSPGRPASPRPDRESSSPESSPRETD